MTAEMLLDSLFDEFISGNIPEAQIVELARQIDVSHIELLMKKVDSIGDPLDYCDDEESHAPVQGFFLFIDLVSALIISLGDAGQQALEKYAGSSSRYVPWVVKYVSDERFHAQIRNQFPI